MPQTLIYRPILIDELITNNRIGSYINVFSPQNDIELMGVYLWNSHVCGAIYPLIGAAEVALRNSIDQAIHSSLGPFWWSGSKLKYKSFSPGGPLPWPVKCVRENLATATNNYKKEKKKRYHIPGNVVPDHAGSVAKTEFSTWEFILDNEFMGNNLIWPGHLGKVFKGTWPSTHASTVLTHARDLVGNIREFRNRLFHHEPAWKRYGVNTEADAISHLHEKIDKIIQLLNLINPEKTRMLEKNRIINAAQRACSSQEIRRFQHLVRTHKIKSIGRFVELADNCSQNNEIIQAKIYKGRQSKFLIIPV